MVFSERVVACLVLVLLIRHAGHSIRDQAPGDGDAICTDEIIDGVANPFFANRPVYSASERPLMDSRDYNRLLQGTGNIYLPWQSVDRDNNNTNEEVTLVRVAIAIQRSAIILCKPLVHSSGLNLQHLHVLGQ